MPFYFEGIFITVADQLTRPFFGFRIAAQTSRRKRSFPLLINQTLRTLAASRRTLIALVAVRLHPMCPTSLAPCGTEHPASLLLFRL